MAVNMAPVYYVTGNHEASRSQYDELKKILFTVPLHPICYAEIAAASKLPYRWKFFILTSIFLYCYTV